MSQLVIFIVYLVSLFLFSKILSAVSRWKTLLALKLVSSVPPAFAQSRTIYLTAVGFFCFLALAMSLAVYKDIELMTFGILGIGFGLVWAVTNGQKTAYQEYRNIAVYLASEANSDEERTNYEEMAKHSNSELRKRVKQFKDYEKQTY